MPLMPPPILLHHHRTEMRCDPVNVKLADLAITLHVDFANSRPTPVLLEPGDSTRYTLLVGRIGQPTAQALGWSKENVLVQVTRLIGGDVAGSCIVDLANPDTFAEVVACANGNDWTRALLVWWVTCLAQETLVHVGRTRGNLADLLKAVMEQAEAQYRQAYPPV